MDYGYKENNMITPIHIFVSGGTADAMWIDNKGNKTEVQLGEISTRWIENFAKAHFAKELKCTEDEIRLIVHDLD